MTLANQLVGMSEIHVAKGPAQFTALGLGSCIGLCVLDPVAEVSAMAHIMLPAAFPDKPVDKPGKFADTAIHDLYEQVLALGAQRSRIRVAYAGGAQVFKFGAGAEGSKLDVGARNSASVADHLKKRDAKVIHFDVGGSNGRTVYFCSATGEIKVRTAASGETILCNLRSGTR